MSGYAQVKASELKPGMQVFTGLRIQTVARVEARPMAAHVGEWLNIYTTCEIDPIAAQPGWSYSVVKSS